MNCKNLSQCIRAWNELTSLTSWHCSKHYTMVQKANLRGNKCSSKITSLQQNSIQLSDQKLHLPSSTCYLDHSPLTLSYRRRGHGCPVGRSSKIEINPQNVFDSAHSGRKRLVATAFAFIVDYHWLAARVVEKFSHDCSHFSHRSARLPFVTIDLVDPILDPSVGGDDDGWCWGQDECFAVHSCSMVGFAAFPWSILWHFSTSDAVNLI